MVEDEVSKYTFSQSWLMSTDHVTCKRIPRPQIQGLPKGAGASGCETTFFPSS